MPKKQEKTPWFLWPFVALWDLLAFILSLTGRLMAAVLGLALMIVGSAGGEEYRKPSLRSCAIGMVLGFVVYVLINLFIFSLPYTIDFFAAPFLFIPDQLGLLYKTTKEDVTTITVTVAHKHDLEIPKSGKYTMYSTKLLPAKDRISLKSKETGERIEVPFILDGINQYDPAVVEGRPIFQFYVAKPGTYEISIGNLYMGAEPEYTLSIAPDFSTRNRIIFALSFFLHGAIIVLAVRTVYYQRNKAKIELEKAAKREKRERFEEWMRKEKQREK